MDTPSILYHYTNADGLIGIIESKNIWLSDYRSLNDRSEIVYAFKLIKEVVEQHTKEYSMLETFDWESMFREDHQGELLFVGSFAQAADNPVLWRLYSKQRGYVLGIKTKSLEGAKEKTKNAYFQRVIYNRDEQIKFIEEKFLEFKKTRPNFKSEHELKEAFDRQFDRINFFFWLYQVAPFVKDSSFEHEQEWRIAVHFRLKSGAKFRTRDGDGDGDIIPYLELSMPAPEGKKHFWLQSVDMGPRVDASRNLPQLEALLDQNGFIKDSIDLRQSLIPI